MAKIVIGSKKRRMSDKFLKPAPNMTAPAIKMALASETKNPLVGQAATIISKSISDGKVLSLSTCTERCSD